MIRLPRTRPDLHFCMKIGLFSCQICSENTFGKIPIDQTTGETINKDTQTPGGTKGFSTKHNLVLYQSTISQLMTGPIASGN